MRMREVPIGELTPNPWNTNHINDPLNEQRLRNSLTEFGVFRPIVVRRLPTGELQILGGEHRWKAAKQLGHTAIPVVDLGEISDEQAKKIGLLDNSRYGEDDPGELSALLSDLGINELSTLLPFTQEELDSLMRVPELPNLDDLDDHGKTQLPDVNNPPAAPTTQIVRFKVPVEDVTWITTLVDRRMKEMGFKQEDALTNAGNALVSLLSEVRQR